MFDLHDLLKNTATLLEFRARERGIEFQFELAEKPFRVNADIQQMEQALINIIKNAMEAIEQNGVIRFSTSLQAQCLRISDNGKGIPDAVAPLLFSPFYTTKNTGQGVGLTLIREILASHQFEFSLSTIRPGETVFSIKF